MLLIICKHSLSTGLKYKNILYSKLIIKILVPISRQSYDVDSSMLVKRYEDQLKVGFDRTQSPTSPPAAAAAMNNKVKQVVSSHQDEQSLSEQTQLNESGYSFSTSKRTGSLRMELNRSGLE